MVGAHSGSAAPDLRKASGFPTDAALLVSSTQSGRLSFPACGEEILGVRVGSGHQSFGKAKTFRKSGGRAAGDR
jgi:hypothetical protein